MEDIHSLQVTEAACSFKAVHTLGDQEVQSMTGMVVCIAEATQGRNLMLFCVAEAVPT